MRNPSVAAVRNLLGLVFTHLFSLFILFCPAAPDKGILVKGTGSWFGVCSLRSEKKNIRQAGPKLEKGGTGLGAGACFFVLCLG